MEQCRAPQPGSSAAVCALPNPSPLPDWFEGKQAVVRLLLQWWECGRDTTPPVHEWTSQLQKGWQVEMSKDQRRKFNKWKNQFSQDYIMVATKISEKQSAGESNRAAAIDAVQLEVTSKVAELRKAMRGAAQTDRTEQFFPLAQRLAREIAHSGATQ